MKTSNDSWYEDCSRNQAGNFPQAVYFRVSGCGCRQKYWEGWAGMEQLPSRKCTASECTRWLLGRGCSLKWQSRWRKSRGPHERETLLGHILYLRDLKLVTKQYKVKLWRGSESCDERMGKCMSVSACKTDTCGQLELMTWLTWWEIWSHIERLCEAMSQFWEPVGLWWC